jgi:hypothetical protein
MKADMTTTSHISAAMHQAVGTLLVTRRSYPITDSDIRRWACAVYYPEPPPARFLEPAHCQAHQLEAPEDFNPFAWVVQSAEGPGTNAEDADPGRSERALGIDPPPLLNEINGGVEISYFAPMRSGDVVRSELRISGYRERTGRMGLMLFTAYEDLWSRQDEAGSEPVVVKRSLLTTIRY